MHEIIVDEANFSSTAEVHSFLAAELEFPDYYGANLDALNDCLQDLDSPCKISLYMDGLAGEDNELAAWFPKLVRSFLRASRENDALEVLVFVNNFSSLERLLGCKGMPDLLQSEDFSFQSLVTQSTL